MDPNCITNSCTFYYDASTPCYKDSELNNGFCRYHQDFLDELDKYTQIDKKYFIDVGKQLKKKFRISKNNSMKKQIVSELLQFYCNHQRQVYKSKYLSGSLYQLLLTLKEKKIMNDADKYIEILFPLFVKINEKEETEEEVEVDEIIRVVI